MIIDGKLRTRLSMLEQVHFTGRLVLMSDLHIGTGETAPLSTLRPNRPCREGDADPEVTLMFRDDQSRPAIPATALKGVLRKAVLDISGEDAVRSLFGEVKATEWRRGPAGEEAVDAGGMGCVWLRMARLSAAPTDAHAKARPFFNCGAVSIITTHVAIDRRTGTADDKKLFYVERVPEGAVFKLRGVFLGSEQEAAEALPVALAPLARSEGLGLGADERFAAGRLRLEGNLDCTRWWFDTDNGEVRFGPSAPIAVPAPASPPQSGALILDLHCRGPYLSVDAAQVQGGANRIPTLKRNQDQPDLPATSLIGALRERAAWLAALDPLDDAERDQPDERFRKTKSWDSTAKLTRTERLFGVAGWKGLVRVVSIEALDGAREASLTSVVLDRFSGAPLDSALFECEAFVGARFRVSLTLDRRTADGHDWPSEDDRTLYDALIAEVCTDGLLLGHATGRGFGWFDDIKEVR